MSENLLCLILCLILNPLQKVLLLFPRNASKLHELLTTNYTFEPQIVTFLQIANYDQIIIALDSLSNVVTPKDNVLVFYAGHGY